MYKSELAGGVHVINYYMYLLNVTARVSRGDLLRLNDYSMQVHFFPSRNIRLSISGASHP